jgi:hypothetical protein
MSSSASATKPTRKTSTAPKAAVAAPVEAAAPATPAPAKVKAPKVAKAAEAAPAPVVAAPVATPAPATTATPAPEVNLISEYNAVVEKLNGARATLTAVFSDMKKLEKQLSREMKKVNKRRSRREENADKPKRDSVFTRPTRISDEMCTFLGKPAGSEVKRGDVTKAVISYAKSKGLQDKQNIKVDATLKKLLGVEESDKLTILNLQTHLRRHYLKAPAATA